MSYPEPNPCTWCKNRIDAGTQSPGQGCYIQFVQEQVVTRQTYELYTHELDANISPGLVHPNGMPDEKYFKDEAISRQKYWKNKSEGVNGFVECDAQYLGKEK